jgi:hypothetical protein
MRQRFLSPALAIAALLAATPAHAGPPWISIELPANPLDATTRGAYLLVHTFHHETVVRQYLEGRAEGMVNGKRVTVPLTFALTSRDNVRALKKNWASEGTWVLVLTAGGPDGATALVGIGADGEVRSIKVPSRNERGYTVPMKVTPADVDAALRQMVALDAPDRAPAGRDLALGLLLAVPAGALILRRRI